jgi:hypothetical protein
MSIIAPIMVGMVAFMMLVMAFLLMCGKTIDLEKRVKKLEEGEE